MSDTIKESNKYEQYSRIDVIGQNGNDGEHYDKTDAIAYIEEHYPETAKEFQRLQFEQWNLFCKKQMDYGPSNIAMGTSLDTPEEKRLSKIGLIVRINDKVQRLINLVVKNNREAQNEPAIDAFKDLSVYGIIAQIVEAGKWGK
jgi:hypothetical protein